MAVEKGIVYFAERGEGNTDKTLEAAKRRAEELGIRDIVVASTRGGTGVKAVEVFKGYNVVVVTHSTGFREPGKQELGEEAAEKIRRGGGKILTTGHAFAGVDRAVRRKFETVGPAEIIAQTLRLLGQGMKVCVECVAMAADAGLIPADRDVISISGSGRGADTAVVIKPANSNRLFDLYVREIIAKPLSP
ncbi:MAG: pyruvate kinase alpha/beta domain-containing protein [Candidatus Bathyarchaeia archaeon]